MVVYPSRSFTLPSNHVSQQRWQCSTLGARAPRICLWCHLPCAESKARRAGKRRYTFLSSARSIRRGRMRAIPVVATRSGTTARPCCSMSECRPAILELIREMRNEYGNGPFRQRLVPRAITQLHRPANALAPAAQRVRPRLRPRRLCLVNEQEAPHLLLLLLLLVVLLVVLLL